MDNCFACGPNEEDDLIQETLSAVDDNFTECDYDRDVTPLYQAIEDRAWPAVNIFLHLGYWPDSLFLDRVKPSRQVRCWVTRYEKRPDGTKKVRWSQLPLHAAIIYGAPSVIIHKLIEMFPNSIRCTDDHMMLPLHLAFRNGLPDPVIAVFLEAFPGAVKCKGYKGKLPVDCAIDCAKNNPNVNVERALIIKTILKENHEKGFSGDIKLMELFSAKEATKIMKRKASNLNCFMKEIEDRKKETENELCQTVQLLKDLKFDTTVKDKRRVQELMEKVDALETVTKDLMQKEEDTKNELHITIEEFEKLKNKKDPVKEDEDFSKLQKVTSYEGPTLLSSKKRGVPSLDLGEDEDETAGNFLSRIYESAKVVSPQVSNGFFGSIFGSSDVKNETTSTQTLKEVKNETHESKGCFGSLCGDTHEAVSEGTHKAVEEDNCCEPFACGSPQEDEPNLKNASFDTSKGSMKFAVKHVEREVAEAKDALRSTIDVLKNLKANGGVDDEVLKVLTQKVASMQSYMGNLEAKESKTSKALESSVKELDELTTKRISLLEKNAAAKGATELRRNSSELEKKASQVESKIEQMEMILVHLTQSSAKTKKELKDTKQQMVSLHKQQMQKLEKSPYTDLTKEKQYIEALSEKFLSLQNDVAGFEAKESKTLKDMERSMRQLEELTAMRFDVLESINAKHLPEAAKLEKLSTLEERKAAALVFELKDVEAQVARTKESLNHAREQLEELNSKQVAGWKEFEELYAQQKKTKEIMKRHEGKLTLQSPVQQGIIDSLANKISQLEETVLTFEAKEAENTYQLHQAIKQVEDVSDKKFRDLVLSQSPKIEFSDSSIKLSLKDIEKRMEEMVEEKLVSSPNEKLDILQQEIIELKTKSIMSVDEKQISKIAFLESAIDRIKEKSTVVAADDWRITELQIELNEIKSVAQVTKEQLDETKMKLQKIEKMNPEKQVLELNEKITKLQEDVIGFEAQEQQTMQELEETMVHLEELTAKRVHVLENMQEQKEIVKSSEIQKLQRKTGRDEKKILDLETSMEGMKIQAKHTREELDMTMKALEEVEAKQATGKMKASVDIMEDKHMIEELTKKVTKLQNTVAIFEEHESKTSQDLVKTKDDLQKTAKELNDLKSDDALETTKGMIEELKKMQAEVLEQADRMLNMNNNTESGDNSAEKQTMDTTKISLLEKTANSVLKELGSIKVTTKVEEQTQEEAGRSTSEASLEQNLEIEKKKTEKKKSKRGFFAGLFGKKKSKQKKEKKVKKGKKKSSAEETKEVKTESNQNGETNENVSEEINEVIKEISSDDKKEQDVIMIDKTKDGADAQGENEEIHQQKNDEENDKEEEKEQEQQASVSGNLKPASSVGVGTSKSENDTPSDTKTAINSSEGIEPKKSTSDASSKSEVIRSKSGEASVAGKSTGDATAKSKQSAVESGTSEIIASKTGGASVAGKSTSDVTSKSKHSAIGITKTRSGVTVAGSAKSGIASKKGGASIAGSMKSGKSKKSLQSKNSKSSRKSQKKTK